MKVLQRTGAISITPFFRWFDLWIGVFIDIKGKAAYFCPIPCCGFKVTW